MRSPLRWAGSKRTLLPRIRALRPEKFERYIEPFMGSACVFFDSEFPAARLSDFNEELVLFFLQLRDSPGDLVSAFESFAPDGSDYYGAREVVPSTLASGARAARFLYLNRFAFNGVYRTNRNGEFNVPRGVRTGALPTRHELEGASSKLAGAQIDCLDYRVATAQAREGDFVYLDPPYVNASRATYGEYGYSSFGSAQDVQNLAAELKRLDEVGARIMLSFNDADDLKEVMGGGWRVETVSRRRTVAGAASKRTALTGEILAVNYPVTHA